MYKLPSLPSIYCLMGNFISCTSCRSIICINKCSLFNPTNNHVVFKCVAFWTINFVPPLFKAGRGSGEFLAKIVLNYTAPSDLNKHSQLLCSAQVPRFLGNHRKTSKQSERTLQLQASLTQAAHCVSLQIHKAVWLFLH